MTDLAKKLREAIDMDAATATDAEWSNLLATAMDVRDALEREPDGDGLKQPVRPFSETYSGYDLLKRTFGTSTEPDEAMVERVALALCQNALGGKTCPCREALAFNCSDAFPGHQARAAIAAMKGDHP